MKHSLDDTIAAIATPIGIGGVGVVRISGDRSIRISKEVIENFPEEISPNHVYHSWLILGGKRLDEIIYYYLKAPHSYTGEDTVEINCHGGRLISQKALDLVIKAGARLAERGEFTRRALLNGKLDLVQAEAVLDLLSARSDALIDSASSQLAGELSSRIRALRGQLVDALAGLEVAIDFPDDAGLTLEPAQVILDVDREVKTLIASAAEGRVHRDGARVVIVGKPNVGKSSLFNILLRSGRAIVSDHPGTTRDTLEEDVLINNLPLTLIDTAGIRQADGGVEAEGIKRARFELDRADLILAVLDASGELSSDDKDVLLSVDRKRGMIVMNKVDLGLIMSLNGEAGSLPVFKLSVTQNQGLDALKEGIVKRLLSVPARAGSFINARQRECLVRASEALTRAIPAVQPELAAIDVKAAILALGEVSGEEISDEVVDRIFDGFCVGK